jgi:C1A family cysteine protease
MGHNEGSGMSDMEKSALLGYFKVEMDAELAQKTKKKAEKAPESYAQVKVKSDSVDWRESGAVNGIVSQGSCGSCWAFAAATPYEWLIHSITGKLKKYSEQQIVSCYTDMYGCGGGNVIWTYYQYTNSHKWALDCKYPYVSGGDAVTRDCTMTDDLADADSVLTVPN